MGISTVGFVVTENKDVFSILSKIENVLIPIIKKYSSGDYVWKDKTSQFPRIECSPSSKFFNIYFKVNNESRILMVHFDCDSDYSEYGDKEIIWSLSYWGLAEEIVLSICEGMKQYGKVYYEANDCDGDIVEVL